MGKVRSIEERKKDLKRKLDLLELKEQKKAIDEKIKAAKKK